MYSIYKKQNEFLFYEEPKWCRTGNWRIRTYIKSQASYRSGPLIKVVVMIYSLQLCWEINIGYSRRTFRGGSKSLCKCNNCIRGKVWTFLWITKQHEAQQQCITNHQQTYHHHRHKYLSWSNVVFAFVSIIHLLLAECSKYKGIPKRLLKAILANKVNHNNRVNTQWMKQFVQGD